MRHIKNPTAAERALWLAQIKHTVLRRAEQRATQVDNPTPVCRPQNTAATAIPPGVSAPGLMVWDWD
jgi:hypothetical protein